METANIMDQVNDIVPCAKTVDKGILESFGEEIPNDTKTIFGSGYIPFDWNNGGNYGIKPNLPGADKFSTDDDVEDFHYLFCEADDPTISDDSQISGYEALEYKPTFYIKTGNKSVHPYFKLSQTVKKTVESEAKYRVAMLMLAAVAAKAVGLKLDLYNPKSKFADTQITNPSRNMRAPGFDHPKSGRKSEYQAGCGQTYDFKEFTDWCILHGQAALCGLSFHNAGILNYLPKSQLEALTDLELWRSLHKKGGRHEELRSIQFAIIKICEAGTLEGFDSDEIITEIRQHIRPEESITESQRQATSASKYIQQERAGQFIAKFNQADFDESLEIYQDEQQEMDQLYQDCFSDKSEEYWLGTGFSYRVSGGIIQPNIRNAWASMAMSIGTKLASLTPRTTLIVSPDQKTDYQQPVTFNLSLTPKSGGKTPINNAIEPFRTSLKWIDYSRELDHQKLKNKLKALQKEIKDGKGELNFRINNSLSEVAPRIKVGDTSIACLKSTLAAAEYWLFISTKVGSVNLASSCSVLISREAVQTFSNLGAFNQNSMASKAFLAGAWSNEVEDVSRKTDSEYSETNHVAFGILAYCQAQEYEKLIKEETNSREIDTGFMTRFLALLLENTERTNCNYKERETEIRDCYQTEIFENMIKLQGILQTTKYIYCNEGAKALYRDVWFPWINSQEHHFKQWLDGFTSKATANVLRTAWAFRCDEIFDFLADSQDFDLPKLEITESAMEKAIEYVKLCTKTTIYTYKKIVKDDALYKAKREAEKPTHIVKGKWGAILSNTQLRQNQLKEWKDSGWDLRKAKQHVKRYVPEFKKAGWNLYDLIESEWGALLK